jgi:hypothetical protein
VYAEWLDTGLITTATGGAATGYTPIATGRVLAIRYVKTDFTDGVDLTVTVEGTGEVIVTLTDMNLATVVYPRSGIHDTAGAAAVYIASGQAIREPVAIANDRIKFVVAAGGDGKFGRFLALIGG